MDLKRLSIVLAGVVLIAFGVGLYSLFYIDNFRFGDISENRSLEIHDNGETVKIDSEGIRVVEDGKSVTISWDGIEVIENGKKTLVGLRDINFFERIDIFSSLTSYEANEAESMQLAEEVDLISIYTTFADTRIVQTDSDRLMVSLKGRYKSNRQVSLNLQDLGDSIKISMTPETGSYTVSQSDLLLEVLIPENFNEDLEFTSSSADLSSDSLRLKKVKVESSSGRIQIDEVHAQESRIKASSGDIRIPMITGDISIASSSGDVTVGPVEPLDEVKVVTSSGDINIGPLSGLSLDIKGTTSSGRISFEGSATSVQNDYDRLFMTLGDGSRQMNLTSSSGNIRLFE